MLSGCELIDTENISLPSQNMKFGGEYPEKTTDLKQVTDKLHIMLNIDVCCIFYLYF
jgi:hypothetical protein